ncbi:MAG: ABC transporter ATP-binding protein [Alphaproteobacteria bacterium]
MNTAQETAGASRSVVASIQDVGLAYWQHRQWNDVLHGVSLDIRAGEIVGLVGESGCGKSSLSLLLLGYRHPSARVQSGKIMFDGQDILAAGEPALTRIRGNRIGFVPQNPTTSLNPGMRVGAQIAETLKVHGRASTAEESTKIIVDLFKDVGLPDPEVLIRRYPHELSGGQQQRVTIAMALACGPDVVVLDEPTTGLDVTTQEQIINLLKHIREQYGTAMLYVTHDLGVLSQLADRISVMYAGHIVETAPTDVLFDFPRHPYTRGLIGSIPRIDGRRAREGRLVGYLDRREMPSGCPFQPRCPLADDQCPTESQHLSDIGGNHEVACRNWKDVEQLSYDDAVMERRANDGAREILLEISGLGLRYGRGTLIDWLNPASKPPLVVRDASFEIEEAEVMALVGESGSGKSTIARAVSGLLPVAEGQIRYRGEKLAPDIDDRPQDVVRKIQLIFQNPDASLNPRQRVSSSLARPIEIFFNHDRKATQELVEKALQEVMLSGDYARRFPDQLSGGERQRIAIARALVTQPDLLLCDEILSALDVSVQANILDLLERLRQETSVAMLFITHDLAVVRRLADRVCVLYHGQVMELGTTEAVFAPPYHPYTLSLLLSVPGSTLRAERPTGPVEPDRQPEPTGCAFAGRCPWQPDDRCFASPPPLRSTEDGLSVRCHLPLDRLMHLASPIENTDPEITPERKANNTP